MRDFKDLVVWEKAHRLTLQVYRATRIFPTEERYGLTAQLRRSAASIPTNIAEGCGRPRHVPSFTTRHRGQEDARGAPSEADG